MHAAVNTTALSLYLASVVAGARGRRRGGKALDLAGAGVLPGGGYLGGHLCFVFGVDVNRTAWEQRPSQWTPVLADTELADRELCRPTRAACRSCCTGQTERCMPRPALALTWAARCRRTQSAMAASRAHGPAARSGSPTAASCAARPARQSPATRRASRRAYRGPRLRIGVADLCHRRGSSPKTPFCAPRTDPTEEAVPLQNGGYALILSYASGYRK